MYNEQRTMYNVQCTMYNSDTFNFYLLTFNCEVGTQIIRMLSNADENGS